MQIFKKLDVYFQIFLLSIIILCGLVSLFKVMAALVYMLYLMFFLGCWQILSYVVHLSFFILRKQPVPRFRLYYFVWSIVALVPMVLNPELFYLTMLLAAGAAVFYLYVSVLELRKFVQQNNF